MRFLAVLSLFFCTTTYAHPLFLAMKGKWIGRGESRQILAGTLQPPYKKIKIQTDAAIQEENLNFSRLLSKNEITEIEIRTDGVEGSTKTYNRDYWIAEDPNLLDRFLFGMLGSETVTSTGHWLVFSSGQNGLIVNQELNPAQPGTVSARGETVFYEDRTEWHEIISIKGEPKIDTKVTFWPLP